MRWQIRWARNAAYGMLPFGAKLREIKRILLPYPAEIPEWTLEEGLILLEMLNEAGCDIRGAVVLEIGSGWRPIIPLLYSLAGAARVVMIDTQRLMDRDTFIGTVRNMKMHSGKIAARLGLEEQVVKAFFAHSTSTLDSGLKHFRMEYRAPYDLNNGSLPYAAFDVVTSRAVLEHVPPALLAPLLGGAYRLLRPGGWTCHAVDNSDHWSHGDRRLSRVNFLRYSEKRFGIFNRFNPLDYQNRLRHSEYMQLFCACSFEVILSRSIPEPDALRALSTLPLDARFQGFSFEDLASLDSYFVARRPLLQPNAPERIACSEK